METLLYSIYITKLVIVVYYQDDYSVRKLFTEWKLATKIYIPLKLFTAWRNKKLYNVAVTAKNEHRSFHYVFKYIVAYTLNLSSWHNEGL